MTTLKDKLLALDFVPKSILLDIDGTVAEDIPNEESHRYPYAKVKDGAVAEVNDVYDMGVNIWFWTSREEKDRQVTMKSLLDAGFKFHGLLMGKPRHGDIAYIDNLKGAFIHVPDGI